MIFVFKIIFVGNKNHNILKSAVSKRLKLDLSIAIYRNKIGS